MNGPAPEIYQITGPEAADIYVEQWETWQDASDGTCHFDECGDLFLYFVRTENTVPVMYFVPDTGTCTRIAPDVYQEGLPVPVGMYGPSAPTSTESAPAPAPADGVQKIVYSTSSPFPVTGTRTESAKTISELTKEGPLSIWYEPDTDEIVPDWCSSDDAIWITEFFGPEEPDFILEITDTILRDVDFMEEYFANHPDKRK